MKKYAVVFLMYFFIPLFSFPQDGHRLSESLLSDTIVTIDSTSYSVGDFVWFYTKYSSYDSGDTSGVDFYLSKFIEYRMKVADAEYEQLDTTREFREEFFKYLKITAHDRMYKGAEQKRDAMVKLEYDRLHWDYEVAHIFLESNEYDSPSAKRRVEKVVEQVESELASGATFESCVEKYSDDKLSKEHGGNVGFITAMVSPYEYENAVYSASVGEVVKVRTTEGWYFIRVLQKRPTKGTVDAAIIIVYPQKENEEGWNNAKQTIDSVYAMLQSGVSFDSLSMRYNTNERLRETNGVLGLIDNGMPYERVIKETLFALEQDGDYSKPLKLPYGYAIVKRRWVLPLPGFAAYEAGYEKRIAADKSRNSVVDNEYLEEMKRTLSFNKYEDELEGSLQYVDASILLGKWTAPNLSTDVTLFELGGEKYGRNDFFEYLQSIQKNHLRDVHDKDMLVRIRFEDYVIRRLEFASMRNMEKNDKEFQYIMQEYHDGMIVYDLMEEVFQYAATDTVGMKFYFNHHRENYVTEPRKEQVTFTCADKKTVEKVQKLLDRQNSWYLGAPKVKDADKIAYYEQKGMPQMYIINSINAKKSKMVTVDVQDKILRRPEDIVETSDDGRKLAGICDKPIVLPDNTITITYYYIESRQQTIKEAKEQLLIDYQRQVEELWLKALKKRHKAVVNQPIVEEIKRYL